MRQVYPRKLHRAVEETGCLGLFANPEEVCTSQAPLSTSTDVTVLNPLTGSAERSWDPLLCIEEETEAQRN